MNSPRSLRQQMSKSAHKLMFFNAKFHLFSALFNNQSFLQSLLRGCSSGHSENTHILVLTLSCFIFFFTFNLVPKIWFMASSSEVIQDFIRNTKMSGYNLDLLVKKRRQETREDEEEREIQKYQSQSLTSFQFFFQCV